VPDTPAWRSHTVNVVRGALIGTVETVPGVSGGTVALVVGVYETIITSAGHFLSGLRLAVADVPRGRGRSRAAAEFRHVSWSVLVPLLAGMFTALVIMARLIEGWVEDSPVQSRALFFGLVLASLWVPFSLAARASRESSSDATQAGTPRDVAADIAAGPGRGWRWRDTILAGAAAVVAFAVVSLPPGHVEPAPLIVVGAAALTVSALVLPGLSGSFILLTIGLYEQTLSALNERDLGYLGLFMLGAAIGLASFVKLLQWLLEHRRKLTLVVLTGVMAGCLRALWPWQEDRALEAPGDHVGAAVGLAALGFALVLAFLIAERRWAAARTG
jgi:putative membrane protein